MVLGATRLVMGICGICGKPGGAGKGGDQGEGVAGVDTGRSLDEPPPGIPGVLPLGFCSPIETLGMLGTARLGKGDIETGRLMGKPPGITGIPGASVADPLSVGSPTDRLGRLGTGRDGKPLGIPVLIAFGVVLFGVVGNTGRPLEGLMDGTDRKASAQINSNTKVSLQVEIQSTQGILEEASDRVEYRGEGTRIGSSIPVRVKE